MFNFIVTTRGVSASFSELPGSAIGASQPTRKSTSLHISERLITNAIPMTVNTIRYAISNESAICIRLGIDCGDACCQVTSSFGNSVVLLTMSERGISICPVILGIIPAGTLVLPKCIKEF